MGVIQWLGEHWFDCAQTIGVVGGLFLTAYTVSKDARARQIGNLIALNDRHDSIWSAFYDRPHLSRILEKKVDLTKQPISDEEWLFVKMLFIHMDTVRRTGKAGMFVKIQGFTKDVSAFMKLPIPKAVWEKLKAFQDEEFVTFIEGLKSTAGEIKSA